MGYFSRFKVRGFKPSNKVFLADGIACTVVGERDNLVVIETRFQPRLREAMLDYNWVFLWLLDHGAKVIVGELVEV